MSLAGKAAIVTGGTSGIGEAAALLFAGDGAKVMITGRNKARGAAVAAQARDLPGEIDFLAGEIVESAFCDRLVDATVERFGRLDILVNNAGLYPPATVVEASDALWREAMAINLDAVFYLTRAAVRRMRDQGEGGSIVNVSSDWGVSGATGHIAYGTTKGALLNFTRSLALDHAAEGIRANCLCPGVTLTPMVETSLHKRFATLEEGMTYLGRYVPLGRVSEPIEQARAIRFLASDESSYMTGAVLSNDGGTTAG
ncbi:MAG: SDR family NAD(P)-dependent oxidoreductase [Proteobacteria bacterium]|nr:SDR family NAD(P)-dependent oxidoreductase [Pseudomonadota bacterium]